MAHELGTYRKPGRHDRVARTPAEAVQAVWDGYKHVKSEAAPAEVNEDATVDATASAPSDAEKRAAAKAEQTKPKPQAPQAPQA